MKRLAAALTAIVLIATAMSGCDSSTGPTTVTVHDTTRIHDTTYLNDRFAGTTVIVHGQWKLTTPTDVGDGYLFQVNDSVTATVAWKSAGPKTYSGKIQRTQLDNSVLNISLIDSSNKIVFAGKLGGIKNGKADSISGSIVDKATYVTISTWTAIRTF